MNRILFLSNDPVLKQKNIDVLTQSGFDVIEASDALEGLLIVGKNGLEAIIIDEELADIDGYRACQKVRQYSQAPIVLVGTEPAEDVWGKVEELGFDSYLKKPLSPSELMCYIKAIIKSSPLQKPGQEVKPAKIKATPVIPPTTARPLKVQDTVKTRKLADKERLAETYTRPSVVDKVAYQMQAEQPMEAEVARALSVSKETPQKVATPAQAESIGAMVADLELQVIKIKTAIARICQLQKRIEEAKTIIHQQQQGLQTVENQLQEVSEQIKNFLN